MIEKFSQIPQQYAGNPTRMPKNHLVTAYSLGIAQFSEAAQPTVVGKATSYHALGKKEKI
jgi:hypothetical protein